MDIFNFAIQMERDGETFYRELAGQVTEKGVVEILRMLADDEAKHVKAIEQIRSRTTEMADTEILDKAKNIFVRMKDFHEEFDFDHGHEALYRQAMEIEQNSIDFYLDRAEQIKDPGQKALFEQLAQEERKHYRLLSGLADFVNRPKSWLEDAEFCHLEEY
jgi:rubrerythrin